jgi:hypothetical protein
MQRVRLGAKRAARLMEGSRPLLRRQRYRFTACMLCEG